MIISKVEIAKQQLESAIKAFHAGDKLAAITLAGASEEILGKLCEKAGKNNAIVSIKSMISLTNKDLCEKELVELFNNARNNLKHIMDEAIDPVEILEIDPQLMLWRAMLNWMTLGRPSSELINNFQEWLSKHPLSID